MLTDRAEVSRFAAARFVELANVAINDHGSFTVALSGGSTPQHLFTELTKTQWRSRVDWSHVNFFWGDERCVAPDHPDSNYRMARDTLLNPLGISAEQIHRMEAERSDRNTAAFEYQMKIARVCDSAADGDPPSLDLVFLGMGTDGHTASLFPETMALSEAERWVVPNHVPILDTYRLTMTAPMINASANVIFLVVGEDKASRLADVLEGPRIPARLPAQLIESTEGQTDWIVDRCAAAKLRTIEDR